MALVYRACGIIQSNEKYLRIATLINHAGTGLYYRMFHDEQYGGFSTEPQQLYEQMLIYESKLKQLLDDGVITEENFQLLLPSSKEIDSQEFDVSLFHKLSLNFIEKFPDIQNVNGDVSSGLTYLDWLNKLVLIITDKNIVKTSNTSFTEKWNEIISILKSLNYDVDKIADLESLSLDDNKRCRLAYLKSEIDLMLKECEELIKTTNMSTLTLDKLLLNFDEAAASHCENENQNNLAGKHNQLKDIKDEVVLTTKVVTLIKNEISETKKIIRFWREKNVEGDTIVLDERLNRLRNQINEQSCSIGNLFSDISLDIVKIKEKINHLDENIKVIDKTRRPASFMGAITSIYNTKTL